MNGLTTKIMKENLDINYKMTPKQKSQILARGAEAIIYLETQNPSTKSKKSSLSKFPSRVGERFRGRSIAGTNLRARSGVGWEKTNAKNLVIKSRIQKSYRILELDRKIRERRTRAETKLLLKASRIINCPVPLIAISSADGRAGKLQSHKIKIPFIDGKKLSEHLDNFSFPKQKSILKQIGKDIAKLHQENIIHGDLTTSNMILVEKGVSEFDNSVLHSGGRENSASQRGMAADFSNSQTKNPIIYFIDFGLGYFNGKYEDKAVDIHLLKQALEAKHFKNWKELFEEFKKGYKQKNPGAEKVFNQLIKVEKRGRYKD